jgi:hypothetical protein
MRSLALTLALVASAARADTPEVFGLPVDKVLHASISANLTAGLSGILIRAGVKPAAALLIGAGTVLAIGALKEVVYDWLLHKGTPDAADFAFDALGTGAGAVAVGLVVSW